VINLSGKAKGDGIHWPLKEGCSEYDLTVSLHSCTEHSGKMHEYSDCTAVLAIMH